MLQRLRSSRFVDLLLKRSQNRESLAEVSTGERWDIPRAASARCLVTRFVRRDGWEARTSAPVRWEDDVLSGDSRRSSGATHWARASPTFTAFSCRVSSVCCSLGCCCFPLITRANSLNSALCCFFRCFIKLAVKGATFQPSCWQFSRAEIAVCSTFVTITYPEIPPCCWHCSSSSSSLLSWWEVDAMLSWSGIRCLCVGVVLWLQCWAHEHSINMPP